MTHGVGGGKSALVAHLHRHSIAGEPDQVAETELSALRRYSLDELHWWHRELHAGIRAPRRAACFGPSSVGQAGRRRSELAALRVAEGIGGPRSRVAPASDVSPLAGRSKPTPI